MVRPPGIDGVTAGDMTAFASTQAGGSVTKTTNPMSWLPWAGTPHAGFTSLAEFDVSRVCPEPSAFIT